MKEGVEHEEANEVSENVDMTYGAEYGCGMKIWKKNGKWHWSVYNKTPHSGTDLSAQGTKSTFDAAFKAATKAAMDDYKDMGKK